MDSLFTTTGMCICDRSGDENDGLYSVLLIDPYSYQCVPHWACPVTPQQRNIYDESERYGWGEGELGP